MKPHRRKNNPPRRESSEVEPTPDQPAPPEEQASPPREPAPREHSSYEAFQELGPQEAPLPEPNALPPGEGDPPPPPPITASTPPRQARRPTRPAKRSRGRGPRPIATGGRSGARPGYQGHRRRQPAPVRGEGISLFSVFLALVALAMIGAIAMIMMPKKLDFIKGYPSGGAALVKPKPRNLLDEAQKFMLKRGGKDLVFSEAEINNYLNQRLQGTQTGLMASLIQFKGCYIDFSPGIAEVYVERSIFGFPLTMSARVRIQRIRQNMQWRAAGGTIGKFSLNSRQLKPVLEVFVRMLENCKDERDVLNQLVDVRFEKDQVVLDSSY